MEINISAMKKILLFAGLLASFVSFGQWPWEKIEGNGHLKKETRSLPGNYTAVSSSGSWDVMIAYGESSQIQVEADENLLPYIETKLEQGRLEIRSKKGANIRSGNKITVYVSVTRLTGISLSGSGNIIGEGKFSNDGSTEFRVSGSGNVKLALHSIRKAELGISGSGNIRLSGTASEVDVRISGSGNADCSNLISDNASASISGSGNVKLNANTSLDAHISGSGTIIYRGAASDIRKHVNGSGKVVKG